MSSRRKKITELRTRLGLTQEKAAQLTGISVSMWQAVEQGKRTPRLPIAAKIAATLGTTVDDLFLS